MDIAPLVVFRIVFGIMMLGGIIRFWVKGWIHAQYVMPKVFFPYFGFEWVKPLGEIGMYLVFFFMGVSALFITFGLFYRVAAVAFFLLFTYVELIDKTNYLNHYYFVSIMALLMIVVPAHRYFSLDVWRKPELQTARISFWPVAIIRAQLGIVYVFAGIAKLNYDWLVRAMPLSLWLPAHSSFPFLGYFFTQKWVAYVFSWFGAGYDLTIPFFLLLKKTRKLAYGFVIVFHVLTAILFPIGMFPYIMIGATLIFFPVTFHRKVIDFLASFFPKVKEKEERDIYRSPLLGKKFLAVFLSFHFLVQLLLPLRPFFYKGNMFWHEHGYRFGWRVMLMEKAGSAFFTAYLPDGSKMDIRNSDYLTPNQEKMVATQPDMLLQYAKFIEQDLNRKGYRDVAVKAKVFVTLNGSGSKLFINPTVDLTNQHESFTQKKWVLPFRS